MPRSADSELIGLLPACETQSTIDIRLRDGEEHFFSTNVELELGKDKPYLARLLRIGELKESATQASNRISVSLSNVESEWSILLASDLRLLELAHIVVGRFYRDLSNEAIFQHKHFFTGKLVNAEADEKQINFAIVRKTTAAGTTIATRNLTPPCAWIFRDNNCRYIGSSLSCNKLRKSRGGCRGNVNEPHNGGWTFPENPSQAAPGTGGNPASGIGTGHCFFEGEMVATQRGEQRIETIRPFWLVRNFNRQTMELEIDTVAENGVHVNFVTEYFEFTFSDGSKIRTTAEEPFFDQYGHFIPAHALRFDASPTIVWRCVRGDWRKVALKSVKRHFGGVWKVYNLSTLRNKTLIVGGFAFHNKEQNGGGILE